MGQNRTECLTRFEICWETVIWNHFGFTLILYRIFLRVSWTHHKIWSNRGSRRFSQLVGAPDEENYRYIRDRWTRLSDVFHAMYYFFLTVYRLKPRAIHWDQSRFTPWTLKLKKILHFDQKWVFSLYEKGKCIFWWSSVFPWNHKGGIKRACKITKPHRMEGVLIPDKLRNSVFAVSRNQMTIFLLPLTWTKSFLIQNPIRQLEKDPDHDCDSK